MDINIKSEILYSKSIKLPPVKLELAKQGFCFSGGVLYNSLPMEIRDTDVYGKF